jgi:hypothetical protein
MCGKLTNVLRCAVAAGNNKPMKNLLLLACIENIEAIFEMQ